VTSPPFEAVLFDFGDTLFHRRGGHVTLVEVARLLGADIDDAAAKREWDAIQAAARLPEELAKGRDLDPATHREAWTALYRPADRIAPGMAELLYEREADPVSWVPFTDTLPALEVLSAAGVGMAVVSDTGWDIRPIFERVGCLGRIGSFVLSYEHGMVKPAAGLFLAACADLGVAPTKALMVGDNPLTDGGSVGAGVTALVLPATPPGEPRGLWSAVQLAGVSA
jgi:FMN phosphatase YigB (HAD superfamily)